MDSYLIYIALVIVVIILFIIVYIVVKKKYDKQDNAIDVSMILALIDTNNVKNIEYIRNKIVLSFKDITLFNIEELHTCGVAGITVVGDKVKFYVDDIKESNEIIYNKIKNYIEGK